VDPADGASKPTSSEAPVSRLPRLLSDAVKMALIGLAYYVIARLSLRLALIEENVTPLWPPTGIALVAFLTLGRRMWPGVALGAFLVNAPISTSLLAAAATAAGNTLAPLLAATLLMRVGFRKELDRLRDAVAIVLLAALLSMVVSATMGAGTLVLSGAISSEDFLPAWSVWWTGDALGILVVAPFLLSLRGLPHRRPRGWARVTEAIGLLLLLGGVSLFVLQADRPFLFLVFPLLGWAAWRFQQLGAAPGALLVSTFAVWAAAGGRGPFAQGTLFDKMLALQAFDAAVAFTSFFFAALVTERLRAREDLERAATDLESRVRQRTFELSAANEELTHEIADRRDAQAKLSQSERLLAEAQRIARVGSWEWDIATNQVTWSDEMYVIHGFTPQQFPVTFEKATELVVPEDVERIQQNVEGAIRGRFTEVPDIQYRIVRPDGEERVLLGGGKLALGSGGDPVRMIGTVQDITERARYEHEHEIAATLQRALLPKELPRTEPVEMAVRYIAGGAGVEVGGDWYDAIELPGGQLAMMVGDVSGRGLQAGIVMAQLRMAARAYALESHDPPTLFERLDELLQQLDPYQMATLIYVVFDPLSFEIRFVSAGHPPPLVLASDGTASFIEHPPSVPLGVAWHIRRPEAVARLEPGTTLILYTDGLVERRGLSIEDGMSRLRQAAETAPPGIDALIDHVIASLVGGEAEDDVALLAVSFRSPVQDLDLRLRADPKELASLRRTLGRWLRSVDASEEEAYDIILACGEACANAIEHAYGPSEAYIEVEGRVEDGQVAVTVRDFGAWRASRAEHRGRGFALMEGLMDSVEVHRQEGGTEVRMKRALRGPATA
jgi:PAS domain S-box-containing protein